MLLMIRFFFFPHILLISGVRIEINILRTYHHFHGQCEMIYFLCKPIEKLDCKVKSENDVSQPKKSPRAAIDKNVKKKKNGRNHSRNEFPLDNKNDLFSLSHCICPSISFVRETFQPNFNAAEQKTTMHQQIV